MHRRTLTKKMGAYYRQFQVAGDWYDNFVYSLVGDVAYMTEPLCQYRVHSHNETNESELKLLGTFEHYQLLNVFCDLADSFGMSKPQARFEEAVRKLGDMCLRYALKMYKNNRNDVAYRYLLLAPVYKQDILEEEKYKALFEMKDLYGSDLKKAINDFDKKHVVERAVSYDPPEGFLRIDREGRVISAE